MAVVSMAMRPPYDRPTQPMRCGSTRLVADENFQGPQAIAQVFRDQQLAEHLHAQIGDGTGILLAGVLLAAPAERRQARHDDHVTAAQPAVGP